MGVKDAVTARFEAICRERRMAVNELAARSGVTPSSVYSMLDPSGGACGVSADLQVYFS